MGLPFAASIVIPVKNQDDSWLGQCVLSALDQTVAAQVVVITSHHTTPSNQVVLQRLQAARSTLVVRRQTGRGFANAVNLGFSLAKST